MDGGVSIEDSITAAREFVKAGINIIDISGGLCDPPKYGGTVRQMISL